MKNLHFKSLKNARDFSCLKNIEGRQIRPRAVIRSGSLYKLKKADAKTLVNDYNLKKVIDLRSSPEKEKKQEVLIDGVEYIEIPYFNEDTLAITSGMGSDVMSAIKRAENTKELIEIVPELSTVYPLMASSDYSLSQLSKCLKTIMGNRDGSVIFHCTAGKDRTGVTSAILLKLLGVSDEDIMEDYLFTNKSFTKKARFLSILCMIFMRSKVLAEKVRRVFLSDSKYLNAFFDKVDERFGSFDAFVSEGLGLTDEEIESFRNYMLI